jgi:hypothetical protein
LFIAPRGRTFEEFKQESLGHGWPSFRDEEVSGEKEAREGVEREGRERMGGGGRGIEMEDGGKRGRGERMGGE